MKKTLSWLLLAVMMGSMTSCSFIFPSQGGENSSSQSSSISESSDLNSSTSFYEDEVEQEKEVLDYTEYKLLEDGESEYRMLLPDETTEGEDWASWELEALFCEATDYTLETVYESEVKYSDDAKLIIIGNTKYTEESGVDVSAIPRDGFVLKTVGSNLFILGQGDGVLYGVYEFLAKTVGFEYFISNVYTIETGVTDLYMPDLDFSEAPDFAVRVDGWSANSGDGSRRSRTMGDAFGSFMTNGIASGVHTSFYFLPQSTYQNEHPEWYADDNQQLCYTAHGDAEEFALMQATLLQKFKDQVDYYFAKGDFRPAISFTMQDNKSWCDCDACQNVLETTGANSTSVIWFLNPIAKDFQEWLEAEWPGHDVSIVFFAYYATEDAPLKEENGELVPYDDSVILEDNLAVWIACLGESYDYTRPISDPVNERMYNFFRDWSILTNKIYVWAYDTNFMNYFAWYDTFDALQELYQYYRSLGVEYVFNQGGYAYGAKTAFDIYKAALNQKLMWDADLNIAAFKSRFFKAWFGDAAPEMKAYYNSFIAWSNYLKTEKDFSGYMYYDGFTAEDYPKAKLEEWMGYIDNAYECIKGLEKSNKAAYNRLNKRIASESMVIRYMLIRLHGETYSAETLAEMKAAFFADAEAYGFSRKNEWFGMDGLFEEPNRFPEG